MKVKVQYAGSVMIRHVSGYFMKYALIMKHEIFVCDISFEFIMVSGQKLQSKNATGISAKLIITEAKKCRNY